MPSNFTMFYLYRQSASSDYGNNANASGNLATSVKALSGAPLSDIKAKKMMVAKKMHPNHTQDQSLYMLQNVYHICCMIWVNQQNKLPALSLTSPTTSVITT
jgi:hypothetical protein